jgi:hypothetical protein
MRRLNIHKNSTVTYQPVKCWQRGPLLNVVLVQVVPPQLQ